MYMQKISAAAILLISLPFACDFGIAESTESGNEIVQATQPASEPNHSQSDLVEAVRYEREVLERQADRQMEGVQELFQWALAVLGIIVSTAVFLAGWFLWSTRRELKKTIEESINDQIELLVGTQAKAVRDRLRAIEEDIERLATAGTKSIVWVVRDEQEAGGDVIAVLRANGINRVGAVVPEIGAPFDTGLPDLAVVSYDATPEASRRIREVLEQLRRRAPPVPLIVYTFNPDGESFRIAGGDSEALSEYAWYVPANFPLQLVAQVLTLARRTPTVDPQ